MRALNQRTPNEKRSIGFHLETFLDDDIRGAIFTNFTHAVEKNITDLTENRRFHHNV